MFFAGDYLVHVLYYGKDIKGSPFTAHAFDWNRIAIKNLRTAGAVGKAVEFDSKVYSIFWF